LRNYELILMLNPDVDEERVDAVMGRVRDLIGNGEVVDEDSWGRKKLAYKIGSYTDANYHHSHISMESESSKALENGLKLTGDVIRHLLIREA